MIRLAFLLIVIMVLLFFLHKFLSRYFSKATSLGMIVLSIFCGYLLFKLLPIESQMKIAISTGLPLSLMAILCFSRYRSLRGS